MEHNQDKENINPNTAFKKQSSADSDILLSDEKQPRLLDLSGSDFANSPVKHKQPAQQPKMSDDLSESSKPLDLEKPLSTPYFGSQEDVSPITNYVADTIMDSLLKETNLKPHDSSNASNETVKLQDPAEADNNQQGIEEFENLVKFDNSMISELNDSDLLDEMAPKEIIKSDNSDKVSRRGKNVSFEDDSLEISMLEPTTFATSSYLFATEEPKNNNGHIIMIGDNQPNRVGPEIMESHPQTPSSSVLTDVNNANTMSNVNQKGDDGISSVPILRNDEHFEPVMLPRATQEYAENLAKELISDTSLGTAFNTMSNDSDFKNSSEPTHLMDLIDTEDSTKEDTPSRLYNQDHGHNNLSNDDQVRAKDNEDERETKEESLVSFEEPSRQHQHSNNDTYEIPAKTSNEEKVEGEPDISLGTSNTSEDKHFIKQPESDNQQMFDMANKDDDYLKHDSQIIREEEEEPSAQEKERKGSANEEGHGAPLHKDERKEEIPAYEEEEELLAHGDGREIPAYQQEIPKNKGELLDAYSSAPKVQPSPSSSSSSPPSNNNGEFLALNKLVATTWLQMSDVLHWKDPLVTGAIFSFGLSLIIAMTFFSIISVVAYYSLFIVTTSLTFRLYRAVMQTLNKKTPLDDLFDKYLTKDITLSSEKTHEIVDVSLVHVNNALLKLRSVLLVEDKIDTLKFGAFAYTLTYIGSWFNGLTLITIAYLALFTVPKFYELYKPQIDQYLNILGVHVSTTMSSIMGKVSSLASSAVHSAQSASTSGGKSQQSKQKSQ